MERISEEVAWNIFRIIQEWQRGEHGIVPFSEVLEKFNSGAAPGTNGITTLFSAKDIQLDRLSDGETFRVTLFNKDNHWDGDLTFGHSGIINNDLENDD